MFLKYWSAFWVLRLCFELWEDFVPVIVHVTGYQIVKIAVFVIITARSMWAGEKFYEDVVARAFEERKEEIEELGNQWANLVTPLQESLIDILEYLVGWLKRRYIMDGGKISLQPRQIVLDPAEAEAMNSRQRKEHMKISRSDSCVKNLLVRCCGLPMPSLWSMYRNKMFEEDLYVFGERSNTFLLRSIVPV